MILVTYAKNMAEWLLKREGVYVVASDAPIPITAGQVFPELETKSPTFAGEEIAGISASYNPAAIFDGKTLPYQPTFR